MKIYFDNCNSETERFITSIKNNNFDYTEWHKNLWKDKSINEIHNMATEFEREKYNNTKEAN